MQNADFLDVGVEGFYRLMFVIDLIFKIHGVMISLGS